MLRSGDFLTYRTRYYSQSRGHSQRSGFSKVPHKYVERGLLVFSALYLLTRVFVYKMTLKCCCFRHVKNVVKNTEKVRFFCGTI